MADQKLTALPLIVTPTTDDLLYIANDPGGAPTSNAITYGNLVVAIGASVLIAPVTISITTILVPANRFSPETILVNAAAGNITVSLPAQATVDAGKRYTIKLILGLNDMIVDADDSVNIDLVSQYRTGLVLQSFTFESSGSKWWVV